MVNLRPTSRKLSGRCRATICFKKSNLTSKLDLCFLGWTYSSLVFFLLIWYCIFFYTQASWIRLRSCWAFGVLCKSLGMCCCQSRHKVPFIYYVIAQNLIWQPNFSPKLRFFCQNKKNFFFDITFWRNFHGEVWSF